MNEQHAIHVVNAPLAELEAVVVGEVADGGYNKAEGWDA